MSYSGNQFVFQPSSLKEVVEMNTFSLTPFCQFSSTMKYEIQETCPGHITVIVVDDRTCNGWSWRWAPSSSDYLIYHFNHLCLLPKLMTKLIILTSESYHHLALALPHSDFWCVPNVCLVLYSLRFPVVILKHHLCMSLTHCSGQAVLWAKYILTRNRINLGTMISPIYF